MKTKTSNLKHFLVIFLVAITCLFGISSCLTSAIVDAVRETKRQNNEESKGPKVIPGDYDFYSVAPSGQILYYKYWGSGEVQVVNPKPLSYGYISGNVVVPEKVKRGDKELSVVRIFDYAFANCSLLTSIVLPKSIKEIAYGNAFSGCANLRTIILYSKDVPRITTNGHTGTRSDTKRVLMIPKESMEKFTGTEYYPSNALMMGSTVTPIPITEDYSFFESGNIDEYMEKNKSLFEAIAGWGPCDNKSYSFISISSNGQPLCYTIAEDGKTVGFTNPKPTKGNYVNGNVIIPPTVEYNGKKYPVTEIKKYGLKCKGAASYFIPSTVSFIDSENGGARQGNNIIVCSATTPPQYPQNAEAAGYVVLVPKSCLDKYKTANTWNQQPELIMEVGDDFQQYLDEGRIEEYMEKAKNSINIDQMWAARDESVRGQREQRQKEYQAQQEQREKEWQAQQKKEMDQLKKQYGAKYVDAMQNGQITIGMPKGLVEYGIQNRLFKRFTSMSLDSQTATREVYDLYRFNPSDILTYKVGWISFTNGKVSSIHWN